MSVLEVEKVTLNYSGVSNLLKSGEMMMACYAAASDAGYIPEDMYVGFDRVQVKARIPSDDRADSN